MELITFDTNLEEPQAHLPYMQSKVSDHNDQFYLVGDLHGNYVKLLSVLIHFKFISYNDEPHIAHYSIIHQLSIFQHTAYTARENENFIEIVHSFLNDSFHLNFDIFPHKRIIFMGDTLCDRGPSDFISLLIFDWMSRIGIEYSGLIGNHEFTICTAHMIAENICLLSSDNSNMKHQYYKSFDYDKLNKICKNIFQNLLLTYFKKLTLFRTLSGSESAQILLTHAPCTKENFERLSALYHKSSQKSFNEVVENIFLTGAKNQDDKINSEEHEWMKCIYEFCNNRNTMTPFFASRNDGINIFGHMSTILDSKKRSIALSETQLCIDRRTGTPGYCAGQIVYIIV